MSLPAMPTYSCVKKVQSELDWHADEAWEGVTAVPLVETAVGGEPTLATNVQSFWTEEALYFRFVCADDRIVATMTGHDDPIYNEDVVEVFLSETGSLTDYKEFELSPTNVKFDAAIVNIPGDKLQVHTDWHATGWETTAVANADRTVRTYDWKLPFAVFEGGTPEAGAEWLMNLYRIDRGATEQDDQYMAWSPTGIVDFHTPSRFGKLRFIEA